MRIFYYSPFSNYRTYSDIILYRSVITHRHPPKSCSSKAIPNDFNRRRKPKTTHVNDYMLIRSRPTTGRSRQWGQRLRKAPRQRMKQRRRQT
ncbi:hypothetical protein I7I50_02833 [Histoplasma capsulatum G186AR]|uniref:Uncharacterized protein n=1 Tax=Ajellomyces capsulatus TaxID=5037 RepID=A0A8H8D6M0_AJECA|nr:hypothetical protein I7I52_00501 [Histoplasma capsulatum]QSS71837.1 hypothetical protein I7I50_02833 [Histoplasma capsulatum G186AR]